MKVVALLVLIVLAAGISPAFAHKSITVDKYNIEVGWKNEPSLVNQQNAIIFEFTIDEGGGTTGVVNAFKDLTATVKSGSVSKQLDILSDSKPGNYYSQIIPTKTGPLTITLQGTLNGVKIDEQTEIEDIEDINIIAFPPSDTGGSSDLAKIKNTLGQVQQDVAQLQGGSSGANSGKSYDYAVFAMGLGAAGVILAVISLVKRK